MYAAVARTLEEFGRLDVAIANAGILGQAATFRTTSPDDAGRVMAVNVSGVVNAVSAATESVIANRGLIVVVTSVFALMNGAGAIPYAMSKAAVSQLGRGLAVELAPHGASAMTAYLALIETDLIRQGIDVDPYALAVLETSPSFLLKRTSPQVAAAAIADGLDIRAQRVLLPRRWRRWPRCTARRDRQVERRPVMLMYVPRGNDLVVVGSAAGRDTTPNWYKNLIAAGEAEVPVGSDRWTVTARELADGSERDECLAARSGGVPRLRLVPRVHRSPHPSGGARTTIRASSQHGPTRPLATTTKHVQECPGPPTSCRPPTRRATHPGLNRWGTEP